VAPTHPMFANIKPGVHTIRVVKDVPATEVTMKLLSIDVCAKKETIKPTAQKSFYMEVIGDSITSGYGFYGVKKKDVKMSHYSVGPSYGRKAADLLDADFSIISRGGIGLQSAAGPGKPTTSDVLYDYVNYYRDQETKYDFARKPDVVVVALGTNDKDTTTYHEQMTKFLAQISARNNEPKLKIVIMHNMMTDRYETLFGQIAAEDPYCWELKVPRTPKGHPSMESEAEFAVMLADFIKTIR
jgi:lysophospholipase L1-like esterase